MTPVATLCYVRLLLSRGRGRERDSPDASFVMLTTSHGRDVQVLSRSGGLQSYNHRTWVLYNRVSSIEDPSSRQEHSLTDVLMAVCDQRILRSRFQTAEPQKL